jgi:hypothetical protein
MAYLAAAEKFFAMAALVAYTAEVRFSAVPRPLSKRVVCRSQSGSSPGQPGLRKHMEVNMSLPASASAPSPDHILQLGLSFWASKTLLSAVEMEVFTELEHF